jgi:hypothetical protein
LGMEKSHRLKRCKCVCRERWWDGGQASV